MYGLTLKAAATAMTVTTIINEEKEREEERDPEVKCGKP